MRRVDYNLKRQLDNQNQSLGNNNQPRMSIQLARAKNTVQDSTYWTTETIRTKSGLGESSVAARRQRPQGSPDRLYNIYVDNGVVRTAYREYPDYEELKWQDQFEVGPGSSVAISFDGYWDLHREDWRMVTDSNPWIFWVNNGNLYAQLWDDESTKVQLASQVSKVKAIRAWRNVNIIAEDQGLVVGYVKNDGSVHYRNFCQQLDERFVWEGERRLSQFTQPAKNLNLFITNDYRLGVIVENANGQIVTSITERAWAGMAIQPEYVAARIGESTIKLEPMKFWETYNSEKVSASVGDSKVDFLYANTTNTLLEIENIPIAMLNKDGEEYEDWGYAIKATFSHPFKVLNVNEVNLVDLAGSRDVPISHIEEVGNSTYIMYVDESMRNGMNAILGEISLEITGALNPANYEYDRIQDKFAPVNLVYPPPEIEVIWNE